MMKLGVTGAFGFDDFPQPVTLSHYSAAGFNAIQIYRRREANIPAASIRSVVSQLPGRIDSIHGHFGDDLDPSSEDESARLRAVETYRGEADYCRQLGGDLVVVHPSPANAPVTKIDAKWAQLRRTFSELARVGEATGVRFAFENMPPQHPVGPDVASLVREVADFGSPHIVFLLDFGHAHMNGDVAAAIRAAGRHLAYTHVHDNDGKNDIHLLPMHGTINWTACREALHAIAYDGVFLLEVFEKPADLPTKLDGEWKARINEIVNRK